MIIKVLKLIKLDQNKVHPSNILSCANNNNSEIYDDKSVKTIEKKNNFCKNCTASKDIWENSYSHELNENTNYFFKNENNNKSSNPYNSGKLIINTNSVSYTHLTLPTICSV